MTFQWSDKTSRSHFHKMTKPASDFSMKWQSLQVSFPQNDITRKWLFNEVINLQAAFPQNDKTRKRLFNEVTNPPGGISTKWQIFRRHFHNMANLQVAFPQSDKPSGVISTKFQQSIKSPSSCMIPNFRHGSTHHTSVSEYCLYFYRRTAPIRRLRRRRKRRKRPNYRAGW